MNEESCLQSTDAYGGDMSTSQSNISCGSSGYVDWILTNYDAATTEDPNVDQELSRLQALKSFRLLDQETEDCYDRLASLTARIFDTPVACITLVDLGRVWQVASYGLSSYPNLQREMPRVTSLCAHTILQKELLLVVPDLLTDSRFRETPWASAGIRYYVGTPLICLEGAHIGTLCIMDCKPRSGFNFGEEQQEQIVDLAASIVDLMVERRQRLSAASPDYPGFTFSEEVQRAAVFLRQELAGLKDDSDFVNVANNAQRYALQSAFDASDFLVSCLVPDGTTLRPRVLNSAGAGDDSNRNLNKRVDSQPKVGEVKAVDMQSFVLNLETAIEAFPRKVHLSLTLHPDLPTEIMFNDLKVFRSVLALLTSACERTQEGFVRLRIYPQEEGQQDRVVVFECEDTGRDVDLDRFEFLFQTPPESVELAQGECLRIDSNTGQVESNAVVCGLPTEPVFGGFAVYPVAEYIGSMGGKYGYRPRFVQNSNGYPSTGSVFWFSIPLRIVTATPRSGIALTLDGIVDSVLESTSLPDTSKEIHRVDRTPTRSWY